MEFKTIKLQLGESMAWINLDRGEVRNALNETMIHELTEVFEWLEYRDDIRVIVIKGNGGAFCAGADLNYMRQTAENNFTHNLEDANKLSRLFRSIYYCSKPVIANVHGAVIGGGNGITAAADIVIAEENTRFAFSEVRLGLTPATISPFVLARCGEAVGRELMLTGRSFTAQEAYNYRLVNEVCSENDMVKAEQRYITHFLQASPYAIAECKQLIRHVMGRQDQFDSIFLHTAQAIARQRSSVDGKEGMTAFLEKRKPYWQ